jgi:hypothetical protein
MDMEGLIQIKNKKRIVDPIKENEVSISANDYGSHSYRELTFSANVWQNQARNRVKASVFIDEAKNRLLLLPVYATDDDGLRVRVKRRDRVSIRVPSSKIKSGRYCLNWEDDVFVVDLNNWRPFKYTASD